MKRINVYITEFEHQEISRQASALGIGFSEMLRRVLDLFIDQEKHGQGKQKAAKQD